jgi:hypothetical protein
MSRDLVNVRLVKVRQKFDTDRLLDPLAMLRDRLRRLDGAVRPGGRVALAVGSRGIDNLSSVVREVAAYIRSRGAEPFIVPAMGSHGGATAEGQAEVLRLYGISEETVGVPVRATMEVVELPGNGLPIRVFMDRYAFDADGVILINRIKPHTDYHGRYESGLMKMALIGLGKLEGATAVHDHGLRGLRELLGAGARRVLDEGRILGGIALVENAHHATMAIDVLKACEIPDREPALLDLAKRNMPSLPVSAIDVLIVDRMGKDISGVGIDPNITGRIGVDGEHDPAAPRIGAMMVCDLTGPSHGNAIGVGLADVITRRLYDKIDLAVTYANVITSSFLQRGRIPVIAATDREAFDIALRGCGGVQSGGARIVRILDTLHLEQLYASAAVVEGLAGNPRIDVTGAPGNQFDEAGGLVPF